MTFKSKLLILSFSIFSLQAASPSPAVAVAELTRGSETSPLLGDGHRLEEGERDDVSIATQDSGLGEMGPPMLPKLCTTQNITCCVL